MWRSTGGFAKGSFHGMARRMPERTGGEEVETVLAVRGAEIQPRGQSGSKKIQHLFWVQRNRNFVGSESPGKTGTVVREWGAGRQLMKGCCHGNIRRERGKYRAEVITAQLPSTKGSVN